MSPSKDPEQDQLHNTTESGSAPDLRISTPEAVFRLLDDLRDAGDERARQWSRIQGMYDRNPPYNPEELKRRGRGYQTNVNTGEMESIIDTNAAAAYESLIEVSALITVRIKPGFLTAEQQAVDVAAVIQDEYTELLQDWEDFFLNSELVTKETFKYGYGIMLWPDSWDWRSKAYRSGAFFFPVRQKATISSLDLFFVRDEMPLRDLYEYIQDEDSARDAGWNVEYVKRTIQQTYTSENARKTSPTGDDGQTSSYEEIQTMIRMNDPQIEMQELKGVPVAHFLVREVSDGKVSHFIIAESMDADKGFLFKKVRQFDSMNEAVWILSYDYGDSWLRSVKGLGHRAFHHTDLSNRLFCSIIDGGQIAASLLVQPQSGADLSKLTVVRAGPLTVIPDGLSAIQQSFSPPIQHLIPLRQMSSELLNNNLGVFRPRMENPTIRQPEKSATQAQIEDSKEARFEKNRAAHRYKCWDRWHQETFRRLLRPDYLFAGFLTDDGDDAWREGFDAVITLLGQQMSVEEIVEESGAPMPGREQALEFFLNCVNRGVPPNLFFSKYKPIKVRARRAIGLGSESQKARALDQLMATRNSMDEVGRRTTEREWTAVTVGSYFEVDRFFPMRNRDQIPSNEMSIAEMETNDMEEGKAIPVGSDQVHSMHFRSHTSRMAAYAQVFQENPFELDLEKALALFQQALPHAAEHLRFLASDPTREAFVKQGAGLLQSLAQAGQAMASAADQIRAAQQKAQQEQAAEIQKLREQADDNAVKLQVEKYKVDKMHEIRMADVASLNQKRMTQLEASIQTSVQKAVNSIMLEREKTMADIENKRMVAQADASSKA